MTKKRKQTRIVWQPFKPGIPMRDGKPVDKSDTVFGLREHETLWVNHLYAVHKWLIEGTEDGPIHLSIRRMDRKASRDWRHFQRIKNELVGPEREGIEVFPPESKLVDTANQYHLFVYPTGMTSPFTWDEGRHVSSETGDEDVAEWLRKSGATEEDIAHVASGAKQRPIEEDER